MDYISREAFSYFNCSLEFHALFCGHGGLCQNEPPTNQPTGNEYAYIQLQTSTQWSEVRTGKGRGRDGGIHCTTGMTATLTQPFDITFHCSGNLGQKSLILSNLVACSGGWPGASLNIEKNPGLKCSSWEKKVIAKPPQLSYWTPWEHHPGIYSHAFPLGQ